eukprot:3750731-Heterocapsa_arctica.AAC.1
MGVANPIAVLSACRANIPALKESLVSWSTLKTLKYSIDGEGDAFNTEVEPVLRQLALGKAFPGSGN